MNQAPDDPSVIIAEPIVPACEAWLKQRARVRHIRAADPGFADAMSSAAGLVVRTYTRVDAPLLDLAPNLRVVGRAGAGIDNIDLDACRERGVRVVHTPGANAPAVAEFVFAALLDIVRPRAALVRPVDADAWQSMRESLTPPTQLAGKTLGVIGLGSVGSRVARLASALGMRVLYHDIRDVLEHERADAEPMPMDALLNMSDVVSVHVDGRPENRHLIGARQCALLKRDGVFVNTSRGLVVDHHALAATMKQCPGLRAILDVHEPEPVEQSNPLLNVPNAMLYPHIAGATASAKEAMSWVVKDVWRVLSGEQPEYGAV